MTCIERSKGGDVGPEDLEDILRDWHSDIDLCKEVSDEPLRRIESERVARVSEANKVQRQEETEEHLSKIQQELQQVKAWQDEVADELQKANKHNEHVQHQLLESKNGHSEEL